MKEFEDYCNRHYLPTLLIDVRMSSNGAADPWEDENYVRCWTYLNYRLHDWRFSHPSDEVFDEAVKTMLVETIKALDSQVAVIEERKKTETLAALSVGT